MVLGRQNIQKNLILRELTIAYLNRKCNNFKAALFEEGLAEQTVED